MRWPDRIVDLLYWPVLVLAWIDALLAGAVVVTVLPAKALIWVIVPTVALAAILFCLMVADPETQRAMKRVNAMASPRSRGKNGGIRLFDREWGLFGSRYPARPLLLINRILLAGSALLMLMIVVLPAEPLYLVFAAYFMTTLAMFPLLKKVRGTEAS